MSSLIFLDVNIFHIIHIYLNVWNQMTDIKFSLLHNNPRNQMRKKNGIIRIS